MWAVTWPVLVTEATVESLELNITPVWVVLKGSTVTLRSSEPFTVSIMDEGDTLIAVAGTSMLDARACGARVSSRHRASSIRHSFFIVLNHPFRVIERCADL